MATRKAVQYVLLLLVLWYYLENGGYRQFLGVFSEKGRETTTSPLHHRGIRQIGASQNTTTLELEVVIDVSNLAEFQAILNMISLPAPINNSSGEITSINLTTVCSPSEVGHLCRCEEDYTWPTNICSSHIVCDAFTGDTCGCIISLPEDGQYCQLNTVQTATVIIDVVFDVRVQASDVSPEFIGLVRNSLSEMSFPISITQSLRLTDLDLSTVCLPQQTGVLLCECEERFAWSCDMRSFFGVCETRIDSTQQCINGVPGDGDFCVPIGRNTQCSTPTPTTTPTTITTTPTTITTTPTTITTTPTTTPTTITTTPTPVTTRTPIPVIENTLTLTLDVDFNPSFNNPNSEVYQNIDAAIQTQAMTHVRTLVSAELIGLRSGSTIADFVIRAESFTNSEMEAVRVGLFTQLSRLYPVIFESDEPVDFQPTEAFFGNPVTITCGPPPPELNFGPEWTAEWRHNGVVVRDHATSVQNQVGTLTVSRFFRTDDGSYECLLRRPDRSVFRQRSSTNFLVLQTPLIQVSPLQQMVSCDAGTVELTCSVNEPYSVQFLNFQNTGQSITERITIPEDCTSGTQQFECQSLTSPSYSRRITLEFVSEDFVCTDERFGNATLNFKAVATCDDDKVGEITATCRESTRFEDVEDNCILLPIKELLDQSEFLTVISLPEFLEALSNVTVDLTSAVGESPATIRAIVEILDNVATISLLTTITEESMKDVLLTAGVLTSDEAQASWGLLNRESMNTSESSVPQSIQRLSLSLTRMSETNVSSVSSSFLQSLETITTRLSNGTFGIDTPLILLNKTTFTDMFNIDVNSSVEIDIPEADTDNKTITVITFTSMDNVLPARDEANSSSLVINGRVVLVQSSGDVNNISFAYERLNNSLENPQCVFWNFSLFDGLGGWDSNGCEFAMSVNDTFTCTCNHLTSFSILMSFDTKISPFLKFITYIGVSISIASLIICLIIEAIVWKKIRSNRLSYLRHVSIVNIAFSLLVANICFFVGAALSFKQNIPGCSAATFFIHLFYLALFFWMFSSALLLLHQTVFVFGGDISKTAMMAIGFCLGYGAPLIIAVITIAVTAPRNEYIRSSGVCFLNWRDSMALLAFVLPALLIVFINTIILIVVLYKMLRSRTFGRNAGQAGDKHVLVVIMRSLAVLTPFFGLTWSLGVGTMLDSDNLAIHGSFAFFNSLQGLFILVFGTLMDRKVREELVKVKTSTISGHGTASTSAGNSSRGLGFLWRRRQPRDGYNISSSATGQSHSYSNT